MRRASRHPIGLYRLLAAFIAVGAMALLLAHPAGAHQTYYYSAGSGEHQCDTDFNLQVTQFGSVRLLRGLAGIDCRYGEVTIGEDVKIYRMVPGTFGVLIADAKDCLNRNRCLAATPYSAAWWPDVYQLNHSWSLITRNGDWRPDASGPSVGERHRDCSGWRTRILTCTEYARVLIW